MQSNEFLSSLLFSASVISPILLMLLIGIFLRRRKVIDDKFSE